MKIDKNKLEIAMARAELNRNTLAEKANMPIPTICNVYELAHYFQHYDKGDTIRSDRHKEYEEQADRATKMLLAALAVDRKAVRHERDH